MKIRLYYNDQAPVTLTLHPEATVDWVMRTVAENKCDWFRLNNRLYNLSHVWMIEGLEDE